MMKSAYVCLRPVLVLPQVASLYKWRAEKFLGYEERGGIAEGRPYAVESGRIICLPLHVELLEIISGLTSGR
jgi:hypothetical protein